MSKEKKTAVLGGSKKIREFLEHTGTELVYISNVIKAVEDECVDSVIILPDYDNGFETVKQFTHTEMESLAEGKRRGMRIYIENYEGYNTYNVSVFGCEVLGKVCHIANEAILAEGILSNVISDGEVLQASGAAYLLAVPKNFDPYIKEHNVLMWIGDFIGTSRVMNKNVSGKKPALIKTGSIYTSLISMSNFDYVNMRPNSRWEKVFGHIFSYILNIPETYIIKAFNSVFPPIKTKFGKTEKMYAKDYENTLDAAVRWHIESGIVIGDGADGSFEMISSNNGQQIYANKRVDAGLYTGWLLYASGKRNKNAEWMQIGENLYDFFVNVGQFSGGRQDGLFTWCYNKNAGPCDMYTIDCGRAGISLCNMYRLTGREDFKNRIKRLAEGFLRWINNDIFYSNAMHLDKEPTMERYEQLTGVETPAIGAEATSFMIMASKICGCNEYIESVIRIADRMVRKYPEYEYYGHTTSSRNARFLMMLLCIQVSGERDYSEMINILIDYLAALQQPCGGIYSEDNITFSNNVQLNSESGITTPWDNDKISDQLYCVNNTLAALSVLKCLPEDTNVNKEKGMLLMKKLVDYVVKIQIESEDKRFHGGWMRAFSMTHWEYFGLDTDKFWGPYCIMAGWTMGIIPIAIMSELDDACPYV